MNELQSRYDKESALWEGKFKFLTEQKENITKQMYENQAKFEDSIKQLQGDKSTVKEVSSLDLLNAEDQKHKEQLKELKEAHWMVISEKDHKI